MTDASAAPEFDAARARIRELEAERAELTEAALRAREWTRAISVRIEDGDKRHDWLPDINRFAKEATALLDAGAEAALAAAHENGRGGERGTI